MGQMLFAPWECLREHRLEGVEATEEEWEDREAMRAKVGKGAHEVLNSH